MNYRLAYRVGFHPWEDASHDQPFVDVFHELMDDEEAGRAAPFGTALDVGTGSGIWGIELAKRGWTVTGVDNVERALERARQRVAKSSVDMRLVDGDVTDVSTDVGGVFDLILDTGTFHGLRPDERLAMGRWIDRVAANDAALYLLVWPPKRRPLIRGVDDTGIGRAFPGWQITAKVPSHFSLPRPLELLLRPDEHWYRLVRSTTTPSRP